MLNWLQSTLVGSIISRIEQLTRGVGQASAWLLLLMALCETAVVVLRYGLDIGSIALQESITYMHAAVFLLGAAYALGADAHVRVDIFYRRASEKTRAWINLWGSILFLAPLCIFIIWSSLPYVLQAWSIREASADPGGIAGVFLLKTLIPVFATLLLLEGFAQMLRALQIITLSKS